MMHERSFSNRSGERGVALIATLLLLMIVSGLCATMAISGNTETAIARNHQVSAEARAAAEAGLIHATQLLVTDLQALVPSAVAARVNVLLAGPDGNVAATADNGSLAPVGGTAPGVTSPLNGSPQISYEMRLLDDDDAIGRNVTLTNVVPGGDIERINENDQRYVDLNLNVVIRAVGYASSGGTATVEATLSPIALPAILTDGDLEITGNAHILGDGGGVHTNADLEVSGSAEIAEDANAAGTVTVQGGGTDIGGAPNSGQATITVPPVSAADHIGKATVILNADGTQTIGGVTLPCPCGSLANPSPWSFSGGTWSLSGTPTDGVYYVNGDVSIGPGSSTIGIIATGSVDITSNHTLTPYADPVTGEVVTPFILTDGDLQITGNADLGTAAIEGQIWVREQLRITGTVDIFGQIIVDDAANDSSLVTENHMSGNGTITNSGAAMSSSFQISAWRWGS